MKLYEAIETYVTRKRADGLSYRWPAHYLMVLGRQLGNVPLESIRVRDVLTFLDDPKTSTNTWVAKYRMLRGFFDFWLARGKIDALPMPVKKISREKSFIPYIYTHSEIRILLKAVRACQKAPRCCIDPTTFRTILIFVYGIGALPGEALRLLIDDLDFNKSVVTIRRNRFSRSRIIPIGPDLRKILEKYYASRQHRETADRHFFLNKYGSALSSGTVERTFKRLRHISGIRRNDESSYQPRVYDLRHTFAVHRISEWIKHGADLNRMLPALSVYMGLVGLRTTEKYLTLTPERFRAQLVKLSPQRGKKKWRDDVGLMNFLSTLSEDCGPGLRPTGGATRPLVQKSQARCAAVTVSRRTQK